MSMSMSAILMLFVSWMTSVDDPNGENYAERERLRHERERINAEHDETIKKLQIKHTEFLKNQTKRMNDFIVENNKNESLTVAEYQEMLNEMKELLQRERQEEMEKINDETKRINLEHQNKYDKIVPLSTKQIDEIKNTEKEKEELLQKLKQEQEANAKERERIIIENQNEYKKLLEIQQQQINDLLAKTEKSDEMRKKQDLEILELNLKFQIQSFDQLYNKLENDYETIKNDIVSYNEQIDDINDELQYMYKYHIDKISNTKYDGYNIVLLGESGCHKSTFGNRLCGDISEYGNKICFVTCTSADACTSETEKKIIKYLYPKPLSIIDTAGFFDPDHRDNKTVEDLVATLRGSGGINAFLFFGKSRFSETYQEILRNMTAIFDDQYHNFWRHIIFVRTDVEGIHRTEFSEWSKQFREQIRKQFPYIDNTYQLPIFACHTWRDYKRYIREEFWRLIPENKFDCKAIESPFQKLRKIVYNSRDIISQKKLKYNDTKFELDQYKNEIMMTLHKIQKLDENLYQTKYQVINEKMTKSEQYLSFDELNEIKEEELSKNSSKYNVEVIDYSQKDFDRSVLPIIIDNKHETEIKQCNVGNMFRNFHEKNPYSMITVDNICSYINSTNSSCPLCPDFKDNHYLWQIKNNPMIISLTILSIILGYLFYPLLSRITSKTPVPLDQKQMEFEGYKKKQTNHDDEKDDDDDEKFIAAPLENDDDEKERYNKVNNIVMLSDDELCKILQEDLENYGHDQKKNKKHPLNELKLYHQDKAKIIFNWKHSLKDNDYQTLLDDLLDENDDIDTEEIVYHILFDIIIGCYDVLHTEYNKIKQNEYVNFTVIDSVWMNIDNFYQLKQNNKLKKRIANIYQYIDSKIDKIYKEIEKKHANNIDADNKGKLSKFIVKCCEAIWSVLHYNFTIYPENFLLNASDTKYDDKIHEKDGGNTGNQIKHCVFPAIMNNDTYETKAWVICNDIE